MKNKINLREMLNNSNVILRENGQYESVLELMKDACKQVLKLAAENSEFYSWDTFDELKKIEEINMTSILDTINQVEI